MNISEALIIHSIIVGIPLLISFFLLRQRGLFHWLSAGFWVWGATLFYFIIAPLGQYYLGNFSYIETRLAVTEGLARLQWVTFMIVVGTACFYAIYFSTRFKTVMLGSRDDSLPPGTWIIMILGLLAATYAIIMFRTSFALMGDQLVIEGGEFTGNITGYQYVAHLFALYPLILMLAFERTRKVGLILAFCYLIARFEDGWNRQSLVSLLLAISMLAIRRKGKQWPDKKWILVIGLITLILTIRGHSGFMDFLKSNSLDAETAENRLVGGGEDAGMLGTLWVQSFLCDRIGYNYGIPFLNHILFGFLPRKYFPWKDNVIAPFGPTEISNLYDEAIEMMFGAKPTVIGDLYSWGGLFTVAVGMACLGYLCRRLDGMVTDDTPLLVRLLGFMLLAEIWMMFPSGLIWSAEVIFVTGLPFFGLHLCTKLFGKPKSTTRRS